VPNLVGLTQLQAVEMLTALGLSPWEEIIPEGAPQTLPGEQTEAPPDESLPEISPGESYIVESQMPAPEKQIAAGTEVKIKLRKTLEEPQSDATPVDIAS
jgi:beta-lactam-binding protein with PASTA domain